MKEEQAKNNQEKIEDLFIEDNMSEINIGDFIDEDERFEKNPPKKALDKKFKESIKKENKKANKLNKKKIFIDGLKKIFDSERIFRAFDFLLNLFSISAIITSVIVTFKYFADGEPYMTAVGCLFVYITIYLNEKIN